MDKISENYRVKREGVNTWVPQFALSTSDLLSWNDFCDIDDRRVTFVTREDATAFVEQQVRIAPLGERK